MPVVAIDTVLEKSDQAIGHSRGGLSTEIHTQTNALGNPTSFYLTGDAAYDLCGSDKLLEVSISQTWLAGKAYDPQARVNKLIKSVQGHTVILSKCHSLQLTNLDKELYQA